MTNLIWRFTPWLLSIALTLFFAYNTFTTHLSGDLLQNAFDLVMLFIFTSLSILGFYDIRQTHRAIIRNFPVSGHIRFIFDKLRPAIRQYLFESDREKAPFSHQQRALVYNRAKNISDSLAFGSLIDPYHVGYEWLMQSLAPVANPDPSSLRITIGGKHCSQPYSASIFNISAMSFGSLSANAILALNKGAQKGKFAHDTGEGSVSMYHEQHQGDLIWEIGSGYFGCRTSEGLFDPALFSQVAQKPQIKMIEIKLSQGAKPGHGGVLPAAKITPEIAKTRVIPIGVDCISPAAHSAFNNPSELLKFVEQLRELSGGKPVGFKLCLGRLTEWFGIVKAMLSTGITPDFIVVDGSEGGTGAAPAEFADHIGMPMRDGLRLVHTSLVGAGIRNQIRLGAAGRIISAFDIMRVCALGADWANSARGFMFALGCIQSRSCNTNRCPTGVATQDAHLQKALVVDDKAERVFNFHRNTLHAVSELLGAAGLKHTSEIRPSKILIRGNKGRPENLAESLLNLDDGALLRADAFEKLNNYVNGLGYAWSQSSEDRWHPSESTSINWAASGLKD